MTAVKRKELLVVAIAYQKHDLQISDDIFDGLILVGEYSFGDVFDIDSPESYSILENVEIFSGEIEMLPERKENRMTADVITDKIASMTI